MRRLTRYRFHLAQELTREEGHFITHTYLKLSDWQSVKPLSEAWGVTSGTLLARYAVETTSSLRRLGTFLWSWVCLFSATVGWNIVVSVHAVMVSVRDPSLR